MTLEQAWNLLGLLNEDANHQAKAFWLSNDISAAIRYQSACFRKNLSELDKDKQQLIRDWIKNDDEFQDYFKCLSGIE